MKIFRCQVCKAYISRDIMYVPRYPTSPGITKPNWEQTTSGGQEDMAELLTVSVACLGIN